MREKRVQVNQAALEFVKASNRDDEVFVVNFNDEAYPRPGLHEQHPSASRTRCSGLTRKAERPCTTRSRFLWTTWRRTGTSATTSGPCSSLRTARDTSSRMDLEILVRKLQGSDATIYGIGILSEEERRAARRAEPALAQPHPSDGRAGLFSRLQPRRSRAW